MWTIFPVSPILLVEAMFVPPPSFPQKESLKFKLLVLLTIG